MKIQKQKIIETSLEMFISYGIKSVTMDDIAKKNGISKKTLYLHFINKKDLVNKAMNFELENPRFSIKDVASTGLNSVEQFYEFYKFIIDMLKNSNSICLEYDLKKYYNEIWLSIKNARRDNFLEEIQNNLEQGIKDGLYREDIDINYIAKTIVRFYLNLLGSENETYTETEIMSPTFHREICRFHMYGICTDKGIEYINKNFK
ncbi:MAG: TetR/AcrR family transcriptional regulator [Marinifilaceae bacterium]|jgi:AcrR family transcriptional regulator|nr:TetR/AcrR family transcriptional regulator [Marinifilaceae bacterium]